MKQLFISVVLIATMFINVVQGRQWTDYKGKTQTADLVSVLQLDEPSVKLQTPAGKIVTIPIRKLSEEDQDYIRQINGKTPVRRTEGNPTPAKDGAWMAPTDSISESVLFPAMQNMNIDSRDAYDRLIQIRDDDPTRLEPDYTIGLLYVFKMKDYVRSRQHFLRCLKNCPEDVGAHINLGTICILTGKYTDAYTYYKKAYKLGGFNATLCQNLGKFIDLSTGTVIALPDTARKKFLEFSEEIAKKGRFSYNPNLGWMFECCSEGRSRESEKSQWFRISGHRPYEFPICIKCGGTGKIFCPANCAGGKVAYMANKTYTFPNGDKATMPTRMYRTCNVCDGKARVACPVCKGSGVDPKTKSGSSYRRSYRDDY